MSESFNLKEIRSLLEMLQKHEITEFKLERGGERLWLKRGLGEQAVSQIQPTAYQQVQAPVQGVTQYGTPAATGRAADTANQQPQRDAGERAPSLTVHTALPTAPSVESVSLHLVESPMVGTFYRRPAVDAEPYFDVGDTVKKGEVLCIVEAMKLMNEIESDVTGVIRQICLDDGQMVEYGEALFRIEAA